MPLSGPPNGRLLLEALMLTPAMLRSLPRVPVPAAAIHALIELVVASVPFDEEFYAATYPDLAAARDSGAIGDLHKHFIEQGYLEGRLGAPPEVDEAFYCETYPDIAAAIERGELTCAFEHYVRGGAAEGRFASAAERDAAQAWRELLDR
ncbi:MAG: hypothetical protein JOZ15_04045 [Acidobacteria bacterium]|nr:hypothetical protein [Acidobacteriota bacterium]